MNGIVDRRVKDFIDALAQAPSMFPATARLVMPDAQQTPAPTSKTKTADRANTIAAAFLCAVIALAPLPFGSTDLGVIGVWVLLLSAIVALASLRPLSVRDMVFLASFAIVAVCWGFVVAEQLSRAPLLAELINPIWQQTASIVGHGVDGFITLARDQPWLSAGSQIACMLSMVGGLLVGRDRTAAHLLLKTFAGSGFVYAIYGIVAFVFWPDYLLWQPKFGYEKSLIATFTNPNVAAVYFGTCTIAWLLMLAKSFGLASEGSSQRWRDTLDALFGQPSRRTMICSAGSFIAVSAMFMTGSRAGSIFSLLVISGAAATLYRRQLGPRGLLLVFPLGAACAIIAALQIFGGRAIRGSARKAYSIPGAGIAISPHSGSSKVHPWLGPDSGTFRWAFPRYRSEEVSIYGIWAQAHSSPLEIASEMGIPFTVLLAVGWLTIFIILARVC